MNRRDFCDPQARFSEFSAPKSGSLLSRTRRLATVAHVRSDNACRSSETLGMTPHMVRRRSAANPFRKRSPILSKMKV